MKTGLSLEEMAAEITRQRGLKEDYLVDTPFPSSDNASFFVCAVIVS